MEKPRRNFLEIMKHIFTHATTKEEVTKYYDEHAHIFDEEMDSLNTKHDHLRVLVDRYCPGAKECMSVLDVGCGTGLVGEQLKLMGFNYIDGLDASAVSLEVAKSKGVYRDLICSYFSKQPLDIPSNSYDMIVTFGSFLKGHLPCDCLYEMIRLVRTGGLMIIVTRASSFDGETAPECTGMPALIQMLENDGKIKKMSWESPFPYVGSIVGTAIVLQVL